MGTNNFLALATIPAGASVGPLAAIDLWTLVPNTGLDKDFTVICVGDFSGTIAIEGSLDGVNFSPVGVNSDGVAVGGFTLGQQTQGGITAENVFDLTPLNVPDVVRYFRPRVAPGCAIRGPVVLTIGGSQNCFCNNATGLTGAQGPTGAQGATGPAGATGPGSPQSFHYQFFADQLDNPNNANWAVSAMAPVVADSLNAALSERRFDDTLEEGVGFLLRIEPSMTSFSALLTSRPQSPPTMARNVGLRLYQREIGDGVSIGPWLARGLSPIAFSPSALNFQKDVRAIAMGVSGPTMSPNTLYQFELTRVSAASGMPGDWDLLEVHIETT